MQSLSNAEVMGLIVVSIALPLVITLIYLRFIVEHAITHFLLIAAVLASYFPVGYFGLEGSARFGDVFPLLVGIYWIGAILSVLISGFIVGAAVLEGKKILE